MIKCSCHDETKIKQGAFRFLFERKPSMARHFFVVPHSKEHGSARLEAIDITEGKEMELPEWLIVDITAKDYEYWDIDKQEEVKQQRYEFIEKQNG